MTRRKCVSLTRNAISRYTHRWRSDVSLNNGHIFPLQLDDMLFPAVPFVNFEHSLPRNYLNLSTIHSLQVFGSQCKHTNTMDDVLEHCSQVCSPRMMSCLKCRQVPFCSSSVETSAVLVNRLAVPRPARAVLVSSSA